MRLGSRVGLYASVIVLSQCAPGQVTRVHLDTLSVLDDAFYSLEIFQSQPLRPVALPDTTGRHPRFFKEFYSWRESKDPEFVILVVSDPQGDLLYIDRNLDDDLTDDGPPLLFPSDRDSLTFDITSKSDPRQRVKLLLARCQTYRRSIDPYTDSVLAACTDQAGNLTPTLAKFVGGMKGEFDFTGRRGSFYFDDRVTLRRGTLLIDGRPYAIGLFDKDNNGRFNDDDDVLIVDGRGNGILRYADQTGVFKLNDVFPLAGRRFKVHGLDRYGSWVDLEETKDSTTSLFIRGIDSSAASGAQKIELGPEIWDIRGKSLSGDAVPLRGYRGKYLLLNFWGEWCKPCLAEIPALVRAAREYSGKDVQFVSFVKVNRLDVARRVIADSGMTWPQVLLTGDVEQYFRIAGYPTNILVLPDGHGCLVPHALSDEFFRRYVH